MKDCNTDSLRLGGEASQAMMNIECRISNDKIVIEALEKLKNSYAKNEQQRLSQPQDVKSQ